MSKTTYKYKVKELNITKISGKIEKFLCVQYQPSSKSICVWAMINNHLPKKDFIVASYGTGHEVDECILGSDYIGTLQLYDGQVVAHFFAIPLHEIVSREKELKIEEQLSPEIEMEL